MSEADEHFSDAELRELLASIDHPVPAIRANDVVMRARASSGWRSALIAATAVFAVASVAAASVHSSFVTHLLEQIRGTPSSAHAARASGEAAGAGLSRGIAFVPGDRVEVEFRAAQPSGALQVRWVDAGSVLLTQTGAEGEAHYALTPMGVIVDNGRSTASYSLVLPRTVARARVRVAGREVLAKDADTISCGGTRDSNDLCTIVLTGAPPR